MPGLVLTQWSCVVWVDVNRWVYSKRNQLSRLVSRPPELERVVMGSLFVGLPPICMQHPTQPVTRLVLCMCHSCCCGAGQPPRQWPWCHAQEVG